MSEPPGGELARRDELFRSDRASSECSQQAETASITSYGVSAERLPLAEDLDVGSLLPQQQRK